MPAVAKETYMATLMIRSMDERVKSELRVLAARRGVSMEQQARDILERAVLGAASGEPFAQRIARRFSSVSMDALPQPARQLQRQLPGQAKAVAKVRVKVKAR
jgi:antitoxin FitA